MRSFIQNFLAVNASTLARADKIAMAVSELLENAVKYASGEETTVAVRVITSYSIHYTKLYDAHWLDDLFRQAKHVRSAEVEALLGAAGEVFSSASSIHERNNFV